MTKRKERGERSSSIPKKVSRNKLLYLLIIAFVFVYFFAKLAFDFSNSLFVKHKDRLNFVVYGPKTTFYSIGIDDAGNYAIPFYPDLKTQIPGGYSYYRIGALGKLVQLDKDPEILRKTFSSITSTFVDFYFYEPKDEVFYGGNTDEDAVLKPHWKQFAFFKSNAQFFDRLYFMFVLNRFQGNNVYDINYLPYNRLKEDTVLKNDTFLDKYIGSFYQKTYRKENLNVQIYYSKNESYNTAEAISSMLNGNGIVVGDLTRNDQETRTCIIKENTTEGYSETAKDMAAFFGCKLEKGDTDVYDILFVLGDLEDKWEVD